MRMSCNGCRVLRKGCCEDCSLRPCLEWIKSSESQANATLFLAKFYGRAGLINLINAGPESLRPAIFTSLLYEACGRIMNPIYGSVGLLGSSNWQRCQAAVDAVLNGSPIMQMQVPDDQHATAAAAHPIMPLKGCDIRHLTKDSTNDLHGVQTRTLFKHFGGTKCQPDSVLEFTAVEASLANQAETNGAVEFGSREEESKVLLELSLCLRPHVRTMEEQNVIEISHGDA